MLISIPYQYLNSNRITHCDTDYFVADTADYCGEKYFAFRVISVENGITSWKLNDNVYGTSSLSPTQVIELLATIFTGCSSEYGCIGQEASFDWELVPVRADKWVSTTIVEDVADPQPSNIYTITTINVNGIGYGVLPYTVWDDASGDGKAAEVTADYIDAIIEYIESLNIPEYVGARNLATNGLSDNFRGVGLLELYFEEAVPVTIDFASDAPSTGTMNFVVETTVQLALEITNTSTISTGDILTLFTTTVSDGITTITSQASPAAFIPYNIFTNQSLDINNTWVLTATLFTELGCGRNNFATGLITSEEIEEAIGLIVDSGGTNITGNSIA